MFKFIKLRTLNYIKSKGGIINIDHKSYLIWNKIKISGNNNYLSVLGTGKFRRCIISIKGSNNKIIIEDGANISFSNLEIVGNNCVITIGKNTDIGGAYLSSKGKNTQLTIGENCMFSRNINVMTYDGHPIYESTTNKQINHPQSIHIGDNVWVAANASILKGVRVNNGCIIAFGSILTKSTSENAIVAGIPAKEIKSNIHWEH